MIWLSNHSCLERNMAVFSCSLLMLLMSQTRNCKAVVYDRHKAPSELKAGESALPLSKGSDLVGRGETFPHSPPGPCSGAYPKSPVHILKGALQSLATSSCRLARGMLVPSVYRKGWVPCLSRAGGGMPGWGFTVAAVVSGS